MSLVSISREATLFLTAKCGCRTHSLPHGHTCAWSPNGGQCYPVGRDNEAGHCDTVAVFRNQGPKRHFGQHLFRFMEENITTAFFIVHVNIIECIANFVRKIRGL